MPLKNSDLTNQEQIAGAMYFVMGRGTEGGNSSYHLSITGVTNEYSDDMAAHVMLQAKQGGITRPDQIGGMGVENGRMVVMGKSGVDWAIVALDARVPAMQETLSQSQTFDQQQFQQHEQWLAQEAQLSQGRGMSRSL